MGPGGDSLSVDLFGASAEALKAAAEALKAQLAPFAEITGLEDSLAFDREEMVLELTPQGRALGFAPDQLARELRQRLTGVEAATFPDGLRTGAIRVELPAPERAADFLDSTLMRTPQGRYVPLADIVTVQTRQGFSTIQRENGVRLVTVSGDLSDDDPARAREILLTLEQDILPRLAEDHGLGFRLSGLAEQEREFLSDALVGLIACLTVIYLTLAWVFSSWLRPLVVMAVIPFGLIGVIYGHHSWGMAMSMFSVVGMLGMAGIIINDSIVLVTTTDEYAAERGLLPSIVDAAADRLRPVILTTATTVMGLGPLMFEQSNQAQFLMPTVITLVYGLGFGMFLVLLIVPALLAVGHDLTRMRASLSRAFRLPGREVGRALRPIPILAALWVGAAWVATLGWPLAGQGPGPLTALLAPGAEGAMAGLRAFALAATGGLALFWVAGGLLVLRGRPRAPAAPPAE
jgi:multidrug efflux pump subunit AcrB